MTGRPSPLRLPSLSSEAIEHGFFTRAGGVSSGIYAALNCGLGSADRAADVAENRARAMASLGHGVETLATVHQIHSSKVVTADRPQIGERPRADALVTAIPGLCLGIVTADCVPVLLADPAARVVGAAHAGWKGATGGVVEATIEAMIGLGAARSRIRLGIGPAIRQPSYEVGPEYVARFTGAERFFRPSPRAGHQLFDLPGYVAWRAAAAGIGQIEDLGVDTAADEAHFFSYRRAILRGEPDYGRLLSAIAIR